MSVQVMSWVLENSQTTMGTRLVLISIANHASHDGGSSWPTTETIARETHLSRSQVMRCLVTAEAMGELAVTRRRGRGHGNLYSFPLYAKCSNMRHFNSEQNVASEGENVASRVVKCRIDADKMSHRVIASRIESNTSAEQPSLTVLIEPSLKEEVHAPESAAHFSLTEGCSKSENPNLLVEIWQTERGAMPAIKGMSPQRLSKCKQRLSSKWFSAEDFRLAVRKAAETPFMLGENERGWRAGFDWFIANDNNINKVIEGNYAGRGNGTSLSKHQQRTRDTLESLRRVKARHDSGAPGEVCGALPGGTDRGGRGDLSGGDGRG